MRFNALFTINLILAGALSAQADNLDVYILTGQSNSLGTTNLEGAHFEPGTHPADAQTGFFWSNVNASNTAYPPVLYGDSGNAIRALQMQQGDGVSPNFWGPEFGFARTMFESGKSDVMVIKASRGGGGNGLWDKMTFETSNDNGHMWGQLRDTVDAALTAIVDAGHTFDVKGLLYLQGESNTTGEAAIADTRLQALINNVQMHIHSSYPGAATDMYSVVGEIAASQSNSNRMTTTNLQSALGDTSSQIAFVRTRDQPLKSDNIHFGRDAKLEIGRRFADAFNSQSWVEDPHLLAGYSANFGSIDAIPHPIAQGLTAAQSLGGTSEAIHDAGTPAWRNVDNTRNVNPGNSQALDAMDFQEMFDQGWRFKATAKVISGGGSALWSVEGAGNDPGWGIAGGNGNMTGIEITRVNGDELEVGLWQQQASINLGPGSADQFHTFELLGTAGSSLYDFYIDGQLHSVGNDLLSGAGLAGFQNTLIFRNDGTSSFVRETYWNEVSLTSLPEPASCGLLALCALMILARQRQGIGL